MTNKSIKIKLNGKSKHLGYFPSAEAANAARIAYELAQDCEFYASARKEI